jgi:hypothetical protein
MTSFSELTYQHLAPFAGGGVKVTADGHEMVFQVQSVTEDERASRIERRRPFHLMLVGPRGMRSPQMLMNFTFEGLGTYEIFVAPRGYAEPGVDDSPLVYQASFT